MIDHCICSQLQALIDYRPGDSDKGRIRWWIWMHHKEELRSSNTGKLLMRFFPGSAKFIHGDPESVKELERRIHHSQNSSDTRCVVLFPSEQSLEVSEFTDMFQNTGNEDEIINWDIIVIDGTWRQAKKLNRDIPLGIDGNPLPRLRINPKTLSKFVCRKQTQKDRICTVEAAMLLLEELQIKDNLRVSVLEGLGILNHAYFYQGRGMDYLTDGKRPQFRVVKPERLAKVLPTDEAILDFLQFEKKKNDRKKFRPHY